ncbi:hypothetical protein [Leeuwenhoekiella nanhaiensis]|uniref:DUF4890 domain-containing protein n=1 Tax=Leeuwenhoekiella nanhaiensis TaxID=1655491 RepID=A0A2G1VPP7_9FLAO|nr:hypothetical protein [Leeuwenhoekiella nanhaiensis]PHQ28600.1 hypothetical protein CJ305_13900 [Leeuwenhoekiella nanhaiensis]
MRTAVMVVILIVLGVYEASAQYGYGRGYGGYGRSRMGSSMMGQTGPSGPTEEPPTAAEIADERLPEYVAEFKLDPFETEVLRTYLEEHFNKVMALQKEKGKDAETMRKDFERMQNDFKSNLKSILTEEEVEKLITMDFSQSAVRKRKKERDN